MLNLTSPLLILGSGSHLASQFALGLRVLSQVSILYPTNGFTLAFFILIVSKKARTNIAIGKVAGGRRARQGEALFRRG